MDTQMELLTEKWNNILQNIREDNGLSDVAFKTWLLPLKIFRIEDKLLKITAPFEQAVTYRKMLPKSYPQIPFPRNLLPKEAQKTSLSRT